MGIIRQAITEFNRQTGRPKAQLIGRAAAAKTL
jgi:hypothetical protein